MDVPIVLIMPDEAQLDITDWTITPALGERMRIEGTDYWIPQGGITWVLPMPGNPPVVHIRLEELPTKGDVGPR